MSTMNQVGTGGKQKPVGCSVDCAFAEIIPSLLIFFSVVDRYIGGHYNNEEITSCTSTLGEEGYKHDAESQIAKFAADILSTLKISRVKTAYEVTDVDGYLERTYLRPASIRARNRIDVWMRRLVSEHEDFIS
ncbi:hypothetical protein RHGRI_003910 [Rhododendron griersonianum]|uniref:Uncharacterized protein n=1 Tax=Rhododendron griersonianum TaxID=479676 RepID=A0AAV6L6N8_9ERIC|nr:hypothetical protein RHGRI_003910 [Rhododendron griersonianum]